MAKANAKTGKDTATKRRKNTKKKAVAEEQFTVEQAEQTQQHSNPGTAAAENTTGAQTKNEAEKG